MLPVKIAELNVKFLTVASPQQRRVFELMTSRAD